MQSRSLTTGRTFGVTFDPWEDFLPTLSEFCRANDLRCGYIPMFLAAFSEVEIVGTCQKLTNPQAPVWSTVHLENVEAMGCGTIAYDEAVDEIRPHVHTSVGEKARSATGYTSHLIGARVQFLVEMIVVEVVAPMMSRPVNRNLYDVPMLTFTP